MFVLGVGSSMKVSRVRPQMQDMFGTPTDASLEAMPNAPPKKFLPRLHIQYQSLGMELMLLI